MPWVIELRVVSLPATARQDHEEAELVVGELVALDVGLDQLGDEVVAGVLAAFGGHLHAVHDQFDRRGRRIIPGELRVLVADHLVGPVEQLLAVFLRHAHQAGDRLQRKLAGHLLDEIAGSLGRGLPWRCRARGRGARRAATRSARGVNAREMILRRWV